MSSVIEVIQGIEFAFKVFDMLPLYGVLFDRDGTVITANSTFLRTIGLQRKEIKGMSAEELERCYVDLKKNIVDIPPHTVRTFRSSLLRKDGTGFPVEHTLAHVVEGEQEVIVSISHKVEGRTLAEERREAEKKIKAAKKRKRQFIANINHEIRTPMNAIVGYAEMLAESDIDEYQRRYVEIIKRNSTRLVAVVNDIMELSKLETGRVRLLKSPVNLYVLIEQLHELFVDQAVGKQLEFTCDVNPDLPAYYVLDADHCRRILTGLLGNAVKYTDMGRVTLSVSGEKRRASRYSLTFRITDTGRGMSAQEQKRVLDLMSPKKDAVTIHNGKCLGLTLSARLARLMDGDIRFESTEGKGSMFSFILPVSAADEQTIHQIGPSRPQRSTEIRKKHPVVLVVDDMPEMSHLVKIYFTGTAIRVLEAGNREKCLEYACDHHPDLILMDLNLIDSDGREITRQLRNNPETKEIPVVAMTGMMLEKKSYRPLFDDFLGKPFHLEELRRIVDKYIEIRPDTVCLPDEKKEKAVPDPDQIGLFWTSKIDALYREAAMSGSLDAVSELGREMQKQGKQAQSPALLETGEKLQRFAGKLDIQGVDHFLTVLESVARKSR